MIKQTLFFTTPVSLSLKNCQLVVAWKDREDTVTRPIEDLGCVVLENQQIHVTLPLLNELVKNNVAVILCDNKLMPTAMLQSLDANTTQAESLKFQLAVSEPMRKQAWRQVIEAKIKNQAAMLNKAGKDGSVLRPFYQNVKSGDADNREGLAARVYWSTLFGQGYKREREVHRPMTCSTMVMPFYEQQPLALCSVRAYCPTWASSTKVATMHFRWPTT